MRREHVVIIPANGGRDAGKAFHLTEMPAAQTEKWALRAMMGLIKGGMEIPDEIVGSGIAGIATLGLTAFGRMDFEIAEPLLDEMFNCIKIYGTPGKEETIRFLVENDIMEVGTRIRLRQEVFALHVGFSLAELRSKLSSAMKNRQGSLNTETSQGQSEQ